MNKNIKDYLHLYLGCECKFGVFVLGQTTEFYGQFVDTRVIHNVLNDLADVKLILRPLYDMTEEERKEWNDMQLKDYNFSTEQLAAAETHYLLLKHFDLFGLHEAGLCLYKNDIK